MLAASRIRERERFCTERELFAADLLQMQQREIIEAIYGCNTCRALSVARFNGASGEKG
jgi:hypothetical protein